MAFMHLFVFRFFSLMHENYGQYDAETLRKMVSTSYRIHNILEATWTVYRNALTTALEVGPELRYYTNVFCAL